MTVTTRTEKGLRMGFVGQSGNIAHKRSRARNHMVLQGGHGQTYEVIVDRGVLKEGGSFAGTIVRKKVAKEVRIRRVMDAATVSLVEVQAPSGPFAFHAEQNSAVAAALDTLMTEMAKAVVPAPELDGLLDRVQAARDGSVVDITHMPENELVAFLMSRG